MDARTQHNAMIALFEATLPSRRDVTVIDANGRAIIRLAGVLVGPVSVDQGSPELATVELMAEHMAEPSRYLDFDCPSPIHFQARVRWDAEHQTVEWVLGGDLGIGPYGLAITEDRLRALAAEWAASQRETDAFLDSLDM
jgi:hypothetical protein